MKDSQLYMIGTERHWTLRQYQPLLNIVEQGWFLAKQQNKGFVGGGIKSYCLKKYLGHISRPLFRSLVRLVTLVFDNSSMLHILI